MRSLFFVSVAYCIFSGTSLSASAQKTINAGNYNDGIPSNKAYKFIEGIEIKAGTPVDQAIVTSATKTVEKGQPTQFIGPLPDIEHTSSLQFKYAQLLDRNVEEVKNIPLFAFINEWWGIHYRYGGTTKKGIDCSAFTGLLMTDVYNLKLPRTAREQYSASSKIEQEDLVEGDLVFFHTTSRGVSHVGVYLGDGHFVHASRNNGVMISSLNESYYSNRYIGAGRMKSGEESVAKKDILN